MCVYEYVCVCVCLSVCLSVCLCVYRWYDPADRSRDSEESAEAKSQPNNTKAPPHFPQNIPESNTNLLPTYLPSNSTSQFEAPAAPPELKNKVLNTFYFLKGTIKQKILPGNAILQRCVMELNRVARYSSHEPCRKLFISRTVSHAIHLTNRVASYSSDV
jgi:hypothetical protein